MRSPRFLLLLLAAAFWSCSDVTVQPGGLCGNGRVDDGESCDDGNGENTDSCTNDCGNAVCGDGFLHIGTEDCDDANSSDTDACLSDCRNASCGDGFVQAGVEDCDDGNGDSEDGCSRACVDEICGDGFVQAGLGESCDDGNLQNGDGCSDSCQIDSAQPGPNCRDVNGLTWCFDDQACGEACNDVCAAYGTVPADLVTWFHAQNEAHECQAIATAFGAPGIQMGSLTHGCLEDEPGPHSVGGGLNGDILCSTFDGCPLSHLTMMDELGLACAAYSRRSICPCVF